MSTTHRELDGSWGICPEPETCQLLFHFPDQTPADMAVIPSEVLSDLLNLLDPPHETDRMLDIEVWLEYHEDQLSQPHRDYDLASVIELRSGKRFWHQHGHLHRDDDKPAIIERNGSLHWYQHGKRHRANGPAYHRADGWDEYWLDGVQMKLEPWQPF